MTFNIKYDPKNCNLLKYGMKYPHMTYDDEAKVINIYLKESKPDEYYLTSPYQMYVDFNKKGEPISIEIIMPAGFDPDERREEGIL